LIWIEADAALSRAAQDSGAENRHGGIAAEAAWNAGLGAK
jgi:hypothetical protein